MRGHSAALLGLTYEGAVHGMRQSQPCEGHSTLEARAVGAKGWAPPPRVSMTLSQQVMLGASLQGAVEELHMPAKAVFLVYSNYVGPLGLQN